ncbi:hypothetical protein WJX72_006762 [[Myrmecia] bisecta]|uniref:Protein kinase domain-containing protein n=1 Tax=[Myrmecia] bisecta TaxID=41462 RepID=A0AAW1PP74_9CHLO
MAAPPPVHSTQALQPFTPQQLAGILGQTVEQPAPRMVGHGGMGTVFLGSWRGEEVVVKVFPLARDYIKEKERLLKVLQTLPLPTDSPIGMPFGFCDNYIEDRGAMIGLFYAGGTLEERGGALTAAQGISVFCQLFGGLVKLHLHGVLHNDLKPANICFLGRPGTPTELLVRIIDWGLGLVLEPGRSAVRGADGSGFTPGMCAPQVQQEEHWSRAGDLYSAGMCLLWWLMLGVGPYKIEELRPAAKLWLSQPKDFLNRLQLAGRKGFTLEVVQILTMLAYVLTADAEAD